MATIPLDGTLNTQTVSVTVKNPKAPAGSTTYLLHILKSPPVKTKFTLSPGDALLNIREILSGERLWPDAEGCYQLCEGYSYAYALTQYGYVSKSGTLSVTRNADKKLVIMDGDDEKEVTEQGNGGQATITWELTKAADNPAIDPSISSEWPDFRGNIKNSGKKDNDNNAVTDVSLPVYAEEGTLYWANKLGDGTDSGAVGSPILLGGDIITYAANKLYRVNTVTGAIKATGTMDHTSSFSITPPTYAEGMLFVALSDGCVQAFNAQTLESLWIYREPEAFGGQPNCPVTVENGYLYTGFWNSETADARFVCLSITDENPDRTDEEKCASWFYTAKGGFYWAGAYVAKDYVLVGTDDGTAFCNGQSSRLLLLDAKTGKLLDSWDNLDGDIRSSVVYDSTTDACYFTAKGGSFYSVRVSEGKLIDKWSVKLKNNVGGIPMSTSSPVVHNGRAYVGVSGAGQFSPYSGHNITVIDVGKRSIAYMVPTQGYPQTSGLLTTAYDAGTGTVYVYFFDNYTPGKLRVLRDKPGQTRPDLTTKEGDLSTAYALFTPTENHAQYAICSPIVDDYGTVYFKNDSGHLMAFGSAITKLEVTQKPAKMQYIAGEKFDPTGMVVTAVYANGEARNVTSYVTCPQQDANQKVTYVPCHEKELTEQDTNLTISFPYVLYHNQSNGTEMDTGVSSKTPNVNIGLTIIPGVLGDVDCNGRIDQTDVQLLLDCEAQVKNQKLIPAISDVSGDKVIDSNDAVLISKYLAGEITAFPAAENNAGE